MSASENQIVVYQPNETVRLDVRLENRTVRLSQKQMAELFGCSSENIIVHLKKIYREEELSEAATAKENLVVQMEGNRTGKSNLYNMARVYDVFSSSGFLDLMQRQQDKLPSPQDIFQLATGKCLPPVLCLTTFTNLVLIASCCNDAQEQLFYIIYSYRERLKAKELEQSLANDAYTSLLGGDKKNYSKKLKELYPTAPEEDKP